MNAKKITYAIECLFCNEDINFLTYETKEDRDKAFDNFINREKEWTRTNNEEMISVKNPKKIILKREYEG